MKVHKNIRFTPATLFGLGGVLFLVFGGLLGIYLGNSSLDIPLHDTYFVIAHFHVVVVISALFGVCWGVYQGFPKIFGRMMNNTLGFIHFWITFIGAFMIFWPLHYVGLASVPRRYYSFDAYQSFNMFGNLNKIITLAAMLVFFAQIIFIINFIYSIFKGRRIASASLKQ